MSVQWIQIWILLTKSMLGRTGSATGSDTADESKEAELASALQKIVASPQEIGFSDGTRTVTVT